MTLARQKTTVPSSLRQRSPRAAQLFAVAFFFAGCARFGAEPTTPEAVIREFAVALSENDGRQAYEMMSESYRKQVGFDQFKRQLESNPDEVVVLATALSRTGTRAQQFAIFSYGEGERIRLEREGGRWVITTDVVDFYCQSTPRDALRSFIRAMDRRRYDVVMRLAPAAEKGDLTPKQMNDQWSGAGRAKVEHLLSNLRDNLENPIEEVGNRATMPYGERLSVQFVREDNLWKIETFQ